MRLRRLRNDDGPSLLDLLGQTSEFTPREVECAMELVEAAVEERDGEYFGILAEDDGRPVGFAVYGPAPLTDAAWDLYWIVTRADQRGRGVGKQLIRGMETDIHERGGKIVRIETSSQESYGSTRAFYEKVRYRVVGHIPDFYKPGDDLVTFARELEPLADALGRAAVSRAAPAALRTAPAPLPGGSFPEAALPEPPTRSAPSRSAAN